jgi:ribosomal protein L21E
MMSYGSSTFPLQQVLEFFSHLIRLLGDNIQIVVKPSLHDGMNVGVHWKFGKY